MLKTPKPSQPIAIPGAEINVAKREVQGLGSQKRDTSESSYLGAGSLYFQDSMSPINTLKTQQGSGSQAASPTRSVSRPNSFTLEMTAPIDIIETSSDDSKSQFDPQTPKSINQNRLFSSTAKTQTVTTASSDASQDLDQVIEQPAIFAMSLKPLPLFKKR